MKAEVRKREMGRTRQGQAGGVVRGGFPTWSRWTVNTERGELGEVGWGGVVACKGVCWGEEE